MRKYLAYAQVLVTVAAILLAWYFWHTGQEKQAHFDTPEPVSATEGLSTATKECEAQFVYILKDEALKADLVPEYAKQDPDKQVTAAIKTPPHRADTTVTSVFDFRTGINTLSYRQEPVPFWGLPGTWAIGARYGLSTEAGDMWSLHARWTLLRTGNVHWSAYGEVNTRPEGLVMIETEWRAW